MIASPPRGSPQLVLPSGRQSLLVLSRVSFPYSNWVSRAGAAAAGFPRPEGADISQQNSAFAAVRQGRRIPREHQSLVTVRTVFTPAQSAHFLEARTLRRRNAPPRTGTTLSSESGHASHANQLRRQHQVRDRGFNQRVGLRRGLGGRWERPPPHAGTSHFLQRQKYRGLHTTCSKVHTHHVVWRGVGS